MMYTKLLEFVPHHCRLLREVTGGAISRCVQLTCGRESMMGTSASPLKDACVETKRVLVPFKEPYFRVVIATVVSLEDT